MRGERVARKGHPQSPAQQESTNPTMPNELSTTNDQGKSTAADAATEAPATKPVQPSMATPTRFDLAQREAKALAASDLVPASYKGNVANTLLAMEVAQRIGASPLAVMQNLHIVQGKPAFSASFLIACVNSCGRFSPLRFEVRGGEDASKKEYMVRAIASDLQDGKDCTGAWITWAMIDGEGWSKKTGNKWATMPEQMFMYRAAAFWSRVFAPEISLGMHTSDEVEDFKGERVAPVATISLSIPQMAQAKQELRNKNASLDDIKERFPNLDPAQLAELTKVAAE